jgi:hypothetical protein
MSNGICVFGDGPYEYHAKFIDAVKIACPNNTDLHVLLSQSLRDNDRTDRTIFFVDTQLKAAKADLLSDEQLLMLHRQRNYYAVSAELERRVALYHALELLSLGRAYGPPK